MWDQGFGLQRGSEHPCPEWLHSELGCASFCPPNQLGPSCSNPLLWWLLVSSDALDVFGEGWDEVGWVAALWPLWPRLSLWGSRGGPDRVVALSPQADVAQQDVAPP